MAEDRGPGGRCDLGGLTKFSTARVLQERGWTSWVLSGSIRRFVRAKFLPAPWGLVTCNLLYSSRSASYTLSPHRDFEGVSEYERVRNRFLQILIALEADASFFYGASLRRVELDPGDCVVYDSAGLHAVDCPQGVERLSLLLIVGDLELVPQVYSELPWVAEGDTDWGSGALGAAARRTGRAFAIHNRARGRTAVMREVEPTPRRRP